MTDAVHSSDPIDRDLRTLRAELARIRDRLAANLEADPRFAGSRVQITLATEEPIPANGGP